MQDDSEKRTGRLLASVPVVLVGLGVLLVGLSFSSLGDRIAASQWTPEDAKAYERVSQELKISAYRTPDRVALSEKEWLAQRERMNRQLKAMQHKLNRVKRLPKQWNRYLLWSGVLLAVVGGLWHKIQTGRVLQTASRKV